MNINGNTKFIPELIKPEALSTSKEMKDGNDVFHHFGSRSPSLSSFYTNISSSQSEGYEPRHLSAFTPQPSVRAHAQPCQQISEQEEKKLEKYYLKHQHIHPPQSDNFEILYEKSKKFPK